MLIKLEQNCIFFLIERLKLGHVFDSQVQVHYYYLMMVWVYCWCSQCSQLKLALMNILTTQKGQSGIFSVKVIKWWNMIHDFVLAACLTLLLIHNTPMIKWELCMIHDFVHVACFSCLIMHLHGITNDLCNLMIKWQFNMIHDFVHVACLFFPYYAPTWHN